MNKIICILFILVVSMERKKTEGYLNIPYKVTDTRELNHLQAEKSSLEISSYQIEYNKALVTVYKDGTAILFPGSGGREGILFYDLESLKKMIKEKIFPVKGDGSFWEQQKERVINLDNSVDYYCKKLSEFLNHEIKISNDSTYLNELSEIVNVKLQAKKIDSNFYGYLAIYLGELIRRDVSGKWMLLPEYTLNVYYIPEIVYDNKFCNPWRHIINELEMASFKPVNLVNLIKEADFVPFAKRGYVQESLNN